MKDDMVVGSTRRKVERLVEDLVGEVAPNFHLPGRFRRSGERATPTARNARPSAVVTITHRNASDRAPVAGRRGLEVPSSERSPVAYV